MNKTVLALLLTLVLVAASAITLISGSGVSVEDSSPNEYSVDITSAPTVFSTEGVRASVAYGVCGPIDLVIVLDDTGSMWGAIGNIKAELPNIIATANTASGGDLRMGYITFKDSVKVRNNLTTNITAVMNSINATSASGGAGGPEASDEAKNTSVNNLPGGMRVDSAGFSGMQYGNFTTPYRAGTVKIVVLITDAPPGGFNDWKDPADVTAMHTHALTAKSKGILVSDVFVPTGGDYAGQAAILAGDANTTGGVFITTAANGTGTGAAIDAIVAACGVAPVPTGNVTGGGWIESPITPPPKKGKAAPNNKATFGFVAHYADGATTPSGNLQYNDHVIGLKVHGNVTTLSVDKTMNTATFSGTAKITQAKTTIIGTYEVIAVDNGEPGKGVDTFAINLSTGYNAGPSVLGGGNIQLHDP